MQHLRQPVSYLRMAAPPGRYQDGDCTDDVIRELRDRWPSTVDIAKQPGLLFRLHAILNAECDDR